MFVIKKRISLPIVATTIPLRPVLIQNAVVVNKIVLIRVFAKLLKSRSRLNLVFMNQLSPRLVFKLLNCSKSSSNKLLNTPKLPQKVLHIGCDTGEIVAHWRLHIENNRCTISYRIFKTIKGKSVTSSLKQNCLGSLKPSKTKNVCNPSQTFYQHVMERNKPRYCLMVKKKLNHFKWNIKNAYVKNDKEKYELLKLKTERKWPKYRLFYDFLWLFLPIF